jgi:hypothetical protein
VKETLNALPDGCAMLNATSAPDLSGRRFIYVGFLVLSCQVAGLSDIDVRFAGDRIFRLLVGATTPFVIVLTCCFICAIRNRA